MMFRRFVKLTLENDAKIKLAFSEAVKVPADEIVLEELTVAWRELREMELLTDSGYKTFQVSDAIRIDIVSLIDTKRRV